MPMSQTVFEIPITYFGGCESGYRARLADRLAPVPGPGELPAAPWALHRRFTPNNGTQKGSPVPALCLGRLQKGSLNRMDITLASHKAQDAYGGLAWSLLSEFDHYGECRSEIQDRNWFQVWSTYALPHGTLICPENPSKALGDLMAGFGASRMEDKIARGVFCVLADRDISNHAKLELAANIDRLIAGLLAHFGPPDIPGSPVFRLRTSA